MARSSTNGARKRGARRKEKVLLKDRAYAQLKDLIQSGTFAPNVFLSERQLVLRLGMSKTPIRSALEHLESQGLVAVSPQQGIVVRDLSAHEITDLFDMRAALEPFVVGRLAGRTLRADQVAILRENLSQQQAAAVAGDAHAATRLDIAFHTLLAELLDNREILAWLARCFDKLHRSILRINRLASGRLLKSYEDHAGIAAALLAGNDAEAGQGMVEHLRYGRQFLLGG
jgi:DNA-binding GntR family transcriptional regulator